MIVRAISCRSLVRKTKALGTTLCSRIMSREWSVGLYCYMSSIRRICDTDQTSRMCRLGFELNFRELRSVIIAYIKVKSWV